MARFLFAERDSFQRFTEPLANLALELLYVGQVPFGADKYDIFQFSHQLLFFLLGRVLATTACSSDLLKLFVLGDVALSPLHRGLGRVDHSKEVLGADGLSLVHSTLIQNLVANRSFLLEAVSIDNVCKRQLFEAVLGHLTRA